MNRAAYAMIRSNLKPGAIWPVEPGALGCKAFNVGLRTAILRKLL